MFSISDNPTLISGDVMRFREVAGAAARPGLIELHIIQPGWGSSGHYSEKVLRKACEAGVYPKGMLQHIDHPTRQQEKDQPARSVNTIAAVLAEAGHYETDGWDKSPENPTGAGVYALADVRPECREDLAWLSGKIGVSHYVEGVAKEGEMDGRKGPIIQELFPSPFNSVDFVTIPGAGGHSRSIAEVLRESQENNQRKKMTDKQESLTLTEVRTKYPEIVTELKKQVAEELKIESLNESQKKELKEAKDKADTLEKQLKEARQKIAEGAARKYVAEEIGKTKLPEKTGKALTEVLIAGISLNEDGTLDTVKFGSVVTEAIKQKVAEVAEILKEAGVSGMHDNGGSFSVGTEADQKKAMEEYRDVLVESGKTREEANRLAGIKEGV